MKPMVLVGIILMVLGGGLLAFGYVSYKDTDPVIDVGPIEVNKTTTKKRRIPPALSGTVFAVGAVLTVAGAMQKKA